MRKNSIINFILLIVILLILVFASLYFFNSFEKKIETKLLNIEYNKAKNISKKIEKFIIPALQNENMQIYKKINKTLYLLRDKHIEYLYILKVKNSKLFYVADGSDKKERAFLNQPFIPEKEKIWDRIISDKQIKVLKRKNIQYIGFTYLYPVVSNKKVKYIIVMDISINIYNKINKIIQIYKKSVFLFFILLGLFILIIIIVLMMNYRQRLKTIIDPLTKIYNRNILDEIQNISLNKKVVAMFDIDHFKRINDTYGHDIGDIILSGIADIIKKNIRNDDILIRFGGEEFLLIMNNIDKETAIKKVDTILEKIRKKTFKIDENISINVTVSSGVNVIPQDDKSIQDSIKKADEQLYLAKTSGRDRYKIYNGEKDIKIFDLNDIEESIKENNIFAFVQPIFNTKEQKVTKYEVLARLKYNDKIYAPFFFLEQLKGTNLYRSFVKIILNKSLEMIKIHKIELNVNFYAEDFFDNSLIEIIKEFENEYKDYMKFLTLEILENNKIQDIELFQKRIDELKNINIKIAVDDFGTEYNNLDYLLVLKPDFLKIDGSIVKEIKSNEYSIKIIESIVILAQKLNVKTVAEFVEDKESFEKLQQLGVDYIQGYYVGKPREEL